MKDKIKEFTSKSGKNIILRSLQEQDAQDLCVYINTLSKEDTYILFSGEIISLDDEVSYIKDMIQKISMCDAVAMVAISENRIVGHSAICRNKINKKRSQHVAEFGISIARDFRGDGIGLELAETVINEAKKHITGLKIIHLTVFEPNKRAQSMYVKLGFIEYGRLPKKILYKGNYVDEIGMYLEV